VNDQDAINQRVYHTRGIENSYATRGLHPTEALALLYAVTKFPHDDILDLGVGSGRTADYLSRISRRYECLDYSPIMIEELKKRMPKLSARLGDMRDLSAFADGSFDLVVAASSLMDAVSHEDRLKTIGEVRRVLRPNGVFLFSGHNRNYHRALGGPILRRSRNPINQARDLMRFVRQSINHQRTRKHRRLEEEYALLDDDSGHDYLLLHYYIDRKSQTRQLERAGFRVVHAIGEGLLELDETTDDSPCENIHYVACRS
jgi:SAM-dependent methyltransferase